MHVQDVNTGVVTFVTGATRSTETPFDPEGFLSPAVLAAYSDYMTKHRVQADGKIRASDNWTKGMPTSRAYRSLTRHFLDLWLLKRGYPARSTDCKSPEDALCAILFNVMLILKNRIDNDHHEELEIDPSWKPGPIQGMPKTIECYGGHDGMGCDKGCQ